MTDPEQGHREGDPGPERGPQSPASNAGHAGAWDAYAVARSVELPYCRGECIRGVPPVCVVHETIATALLDASMRAVETFYRQVNARAEADMLAGNPITGAHHRALEGHIGLWRAWRESLQAPALAASASERGKGRA